MTSTPAQRCGVLVLADTTHDARGAVDPLRIDRVDLRVCPDPENFVAASDAVCADMVLLVLRTLERCREVLQQLYAGERAGRRARQRVLLLVDKDRVRDAFEMCRAGEADDYVQHWPISLDGYRLRMSVHAWLRGAAAAAATVPAPATLPAPAAPPAAPASAAAPAATAAGPTQSPARPAAPPQVLLVDDDPFQYKLTRMMLADCGVRLVWRDRAATALAQLGEDPPQLVLMDIDMPQLDGIQAVRELRRLPGMAQVPVIMLTSHSDRDRVVQSLQVGASGFVVKPFSKKMLLDVMAKHLKLPGTDNVGPSSTPQFPVSVP